MGLDAASLGPITLGPITLGWLSFDTEIRVDAEPPLDAYQVNLVSAGQPRAYCGEDQMVATSTRGMIFRPDRPTGFEGWRARPDARHQDRTTRPRGRAAATAPSTRHQTDRASSLRSTSPAAPQPIGTGWCARSPRGLFDPESLFRQPLMTAPLVHAILSGLLLSADHDLRAQLDAPARSIGPTTVRRADEYIEQHAHEPLTVAQVALSAGVSIRALQQGFKRSLGATPHQIIQHTRLERAHHDLVNASSRRSHRGQHRREMGLPARGPLCRSLLTRATTRIRRRRSGARGSTDRAG